jgi:PTH1 family peptidyl-tRNA hydrolase
MFFKSKDTSIKWIVVFLGNPGSRYENTRHNAGFLTADVIEQATSTKINRLKYNSLTTTAILGKQRVFLMKPQTYMNLSGNAVRQAMKYYNVPLSNIIAVSDDVSLPTGKLRIRRFGSAGGHNGLDSLIDRCGGEGFPRIKIGVGAPPHEDYDLADWVLSKFTGDDIGLIKEATEKAAKALEIIINKSIEQAMGEYN